MKVLLIKICKIQPADLLFLFVFISFYISMYHFSQISRLHSKISEKNIFATNLSFQRIRSDSPPPLTPLMVKIYKAWQKFFSMLPNTSLILCRKSTLIIWQGQPHLPNSELMCYPTVTLSPHCSALDFNLDSAGKGKMVTENLEKLLSSILITLIWFISRKQRGFSIGKIPEKKEESLRFLFL